MSITMQTHLANEMRRKRLRIQLRMHRKCTQRQAAVLSGIRYGTYVQAETYGLMSPRTEVRVRRWLYGTNGRRKA